MSHRRLWVLLIFLGLAGALPSCTTTRMVEHHAETGRWNLRLPARFAAWTPFLLQQLESLEESYSADAARWPVDSPSPSLQIWVAADALESAALAKRRQLLGDPRVARTHPDQRIALIPLPRNDALLASFSHPPQTWVQTFRHEAAHLLSLERPGLRAAPRWFQEGYAESWCGETPSPWPSKMDQWLSANWTSYYAEAMSEKGQENALDLLSGLPSEVRMGGWRALARLALLENHHRPWSDVELWSSQKFLQIFSENLEWGFLRRTFGREVGQDEQTGAYLLVTPPGEIVSLQKEEWDGFSPLSMQLQVGRTGNAEAGIILHGAEGKRLRLRMNVFGSITAYVEEGLMKVEAYQGQTPSGKRAGASRSVQFSRTQEGLQVQSGNYARFFSEDEAPGGPFLVELYVRDGAFLANFTP